MSLIAQSPKALEIFYAYAHEDEPLRADLDKHLSLLKRQGYISSWYDRAIRAGTEWVSEIDTHLETAYIILLLISSDFLASEYCYGWEMMRALERHHMREARVIPIILRPVDWEDAPFGKLQALPTAGKPVTIWQDRDEAFRDVAQGIRRILQEFRFQSATEIASSSKISDAEMHLPVSPPVFLFNQSLPYPSEFYGRVRERETLLNRTRNGASTSIVGPRRVGKTWLMSYVKLVANKELGRRFRIGYVDATTARCATITGFTMSALEALSSQQQIFNSNDEGLALLEHIVQELASKKQVPVLCIDEFEGFGNRQVFDVHFFAALRAMTQYGLCLIVVSKSSLIDFIGDYGKTSGFFNVFEQLRLGPFSPKEAERFVLAKRTQAGLTELERQYLLRYGQYSNEYWPIRLQLVGKMLLEDKTLALREGDQDYYRPEDSYYWQEFERRLDEIYGGAVR